MDKVKKNIEKREKQGKSTPVESEFFEIHGSKFKLDPFGNLDQASELRKTHGIFLFSVSKDPFDGLLA